MLLVAPASADESAGVFVGGDWQGPVIGGDGGADFRSRCDDGEFLVGLDTTNDKFLKTVRAICAKAQGGALGAAQRRGAEFGTIGRNRMALDCPATAPALNWIGVSADGFDVIGVWRVRLRCGAFAVEQPIGAEVITLIFGGYAADTKIQFPVNREPTSIDSFTECPPGHAINGIHGRAGLFVHALGITCRPVIVTPPQSAPEPVMATEIAPDGMSVVFKNPTVRRGVNELSGGDVFRLDWCREIGMNCGEPAALAYCLRHGYQTAASFAIAEKVGPTATLNDSALCANPNCAGFAVITCSAPINDRAIMNPKGVNPNAAPPPSLDTAVLKPSGVDVGAISSSADKNDLVKGGFLGSSGAAAGPGATDANCTSGFVWRAARAEDLVCVTPDARARIAAENSAADERRDPGGAYGPNSCKAGFVWRNAYDGDAVCVTPESRALSLEENRLGATRRAH